MLAPTSTRSPVSVPSVASVTYCAEVGAPPPPEPHAEPIEVRFPPLQEAQPSAGTLTEVANRPPLPVKLVVLWSLVVSFRKTGAPETPVGEAKAKSAACVAKAAVIVPLEVTGPPDTVKIAGIAILTLVTVPLDAPAFCKIPKY